MKFSLSVLLFSLIFINEYIALNIENYINYIEHLSQDEKFLADYSQSSLKLFSQPDYLYGPTPRSFPCAIDPDKHLQETVATSVHRLQPSDIGCIAALGDSLTTGLASHALSPYDLLFENQGVSWSMGGDYVYSRVLSIPNILRLYNPNLFGYLSSNFLLSGNPMNISLHGLNVAYSDTRAIHLPEQTQMLLDRMKLNVSCHWNDHWKLINIFVGHSDLCNFCHDSNSSMSTPEQYLSSVREALDLLYNSSIPRTLINLIPVYDVRHVRDLIRNNSVCQVLQKKVCPCAAFATDEQAETLDDYIPKYRQGLFDLIHSGRYEGREDFTVVIQPFMIKATPAKRQDNQYDFSYFAPDCFHWSGKGHWQIALSLWNNMLEPVGRKRFSWFTDGVLKCPSEAYPYIFTSKNSAAALQERTSTASTTLSSVTTTSVTTSTFSTMNASEVQLNSTSHHKHPKEKKTEQKDSKLKKSNIYLLFGVLVLIVLIVLLIVTRRKTSSAFMSRKRQRHFKRFTNSTVDDEDEQDEVEVWNHAVRTSAQSNPREIPKTLGSRIDFE